MIAIAQPSQPNQPSQPINAIKVFAPIKTDSSIASSAQRQHCGCHNCLCNPKCPSCPVPVSSCCTAQPADPAASPKGIAQPSQALDFIWATKVQLVSRSYSSDVLTLPQKSSYCYFLFDYVYSLYFIWRLWIRLGLILVSFSHTTSFENSKDRYRALISLCSAAAIKSHLSQPEADIEALQQLLHRTIHFRVAKVP